MAAGTTAAAFATPRREFVTRRRATSSVAPTCVTGAVSAVRAALSKLVHSIGVGFPSATTLKSVSPSSSMTPATMGRLRDATRRFVGWANGGIDQRYAPYPAEQFSDATILRDRRTP